MRKLGGRAFLARDIVRLVIRRAFASTSDFHSYVQLATMQDTNPRSAPFTLHPTCLDGKSILCRPRTTDIWTLRDLLLDPHHLPLIPLLEPEVIVDLGANVGYTTAHFACLYPSAQVIALEPQEGNFDIALKNVHPWQGRVRLINAAIWSSDGCVRLEGSAANAFKVSATPAADVEGATWSSKCPVVQSRSMESVISEFQIDRIDYIKMDIEGGEEQLLLYSDTYWLSHVDAIKIELHHSTYDEIRVSLEKHGFQCRRVASRWRPCIMATRI